MVDTVTPEVRSRIMARIRSRDTGPELAMAAALQSAGVHGWRRQRKVFGVSCDFVWPKLKALLMIQGCFWHSHRTHFRLPKTRRSWWRCKLARNAERDREQFTKFEQGGWLCIKVWECRIHKWRPEAVAAYVRRALVRRTA